MSDKPDERIPLGAFDIYEHVFEKVDYMAAFFDLLEEAVKASYVLHNEAIPAAEARGRAMSKLAVAIHTAKERASILTPRSVGMHPGLGMPYGTPSEKEAEIARKNYRECFPDIAAVWDRANETVENVRFYTREEEDQYEL